MNKTDFDQNLLALAISIICKIRLIQCNDTFLTFIDFSKALDYVQTEFLSHKRLNIGISGNIYYAIKDMHTNSISCVQINRCLGRWFELKSGVCQVDSLSPTLFSIVINDLANDIIRQECGIMVENDILSLSMYTDDIVILSETKGALKTMSANSDMIASNAKNPNIPPRSGKQKVDKSKQQQGNSNNTN